RGVTCCACSWSGRRRTSRWCWCCGCPGSARSHSSTPSTVVTVALGSTLATILLSADVSWVEGVTALVLLVALQMAVSWSTSHAGPGRSVVTARPTTVLQDGVLDEDAMLGQRLTAAEVKQAARGSGLGGFDQ